MRNRPNKLSIILRFVGFTILCSLFGVGAGWILAATAMMTSKRYENQIFAECMPILITGAIIGLVVGIVISIRTVKAGLKAQARFEEKLIGGKGRARISRNLPIYNGVPAFMITIYIFNLDRLTPAFGARHVVYVHLGIILAIFAVCLLLHDRIPKRFIVPIGIIGWLLTLLTAAVIAFHNT